jgi:hypothetical protein
LVNELDVPLKILASQLLGALSLEELEDLARLLGKVIAKK